VYLLVDQLTIGIDSRFLTNGAEYLRIRGNCEQWNRILVLVEGLGGKSPVDT